MALEWRGNNLYFYEKERNGDKVRSVYSGKGEIAYLLHQLNLGKKLEKDEEKQRKNKDKLRLQENEIENVIESFSEHCRNLTDAYLLVKGYHQHKRQWRKKRNGKRRK